MTLLEWLPIIVWACPFFLIVGFAAWTIWGDRHDTAILEDREVAWLETIPTLTSDPHPWA